MKMLKTKYRIFKKETLDGVSNVISTSYVIRKRLLFFWYVPVKLYYCHQYCREMGHGFTEKSEGVAVESVSGEYEFSSPILAMKYCEEFLVNSYKLDFLGERILKMDSRSHTEPIYVNLSRDLDLDKKKVIFEFDEDLDKLKSKIASRHLSTKVSKVKNIIVK